MPEFSDRRQHATIAGNVCNSSIKKLQRSDDRTNCIKKFSDRRKGWSRRYFARPFVFKQNIGEYYCLLCDCIIYSYSSVVDHIQGKRHAISLERYGSDISFLGDDYYYCACCECVVPYYTNVYNHVTGKRHRNLSSKNSWSVDWKSCGSFLRPFVLCENFDNYYCLVCGCYMSGILAYELHVRGKLHEFFIETFGRHIYPMGNDYYYCAECDCIVPHYRNVYQHVNGRRHENSSERRFESIVRKKTKIESIKKPTNAEIEEKSKLTIAFDENRRDQIKIEESRRSIILSDISDFGESRYGDLSEEINEEDNFVAGCEKVKETEFRPKKPTKLPLFPDEFLKPFIVQRNLHKKLDDEDYPEFCKTKTQTKKSTSFVKDFYDRFINRKNLLGGINVEEKKDENNSEEKTEEKEVEGIFDELILPYRERYT